MNARHVVGDQVRLRGPLLLILVGPRVRAWVAPEGLTTLLSFWEP